MLPESSMIEKSSCCGCQACFNACPSGAIAMIADQEGFGYPSVDNTSCINCLLCQQACPVLSPLPRVTHQSAFAVVSHDQAIRLASSSGGVFSLLANTVLAEEGVVFGAIYDNGVIKHTRVEVAAGLDRLRGSKYAQSDIADVYRQVRSYLECGRRVLFVGTSCQVAGLANFLGARHPLLLCCDFICHGVPTPKALAEYILWHERQHGARVTSVQFRSKHLGWKRFCMRVTFEKGQDYIAPLDRDHYMRAFLKDLCLRPSCYKCNFKTPNRLSDITLADFWGVQHVCPTMDDDRGTSLVLGNTPEGEVALNGIKHQANFVEVDMVHALSYNPSATSSVRYNPKRKDFMRDLGKMPFDALVTKYGHPSLAERAVARTKWLLRKVLANLRIRDGA